MEKVFNFIDYYWKSLGIREKQDQEKGDKIIDQKFKIIDKEKCVYKGQKINDLPDGTGTYKCSDGNN